jgi:hypothetical protein
VDAEILLDGKGRVDGECLVAQGADVNLFVLLFVLGTFVRFN